MLNPKEIEPLLDDVKLIARACKIACDENDQLKRKYAFGLVNDLVDRLFKDMSLLKESN
ncbi:MAG: hypothetical protein AABY22_13510 [Nanoarchaeota archaeon]